MQPLCYMSSFYGGRRGHDHMVVGLQLPMQSLPITTNIVSLNPTHGGILDTT